MKAIFSSTTRLLSLLTLSLVLLCGFAGISMADEETDFLPKDLSGFYLETKGDLTGLSFNNDSNITPFFGATLNLGEESISENAFIPDGSSLVPEKKQPYLLGAEIDCCLSEDTRLTLNYNWRPTSVPAFMNAVSDRNNPVEEQYNISVGLNVVF